MTNDHFSRQAQQYSQYRPHYPEALFDYLFQLGDIRRVWDCATGNGQAAKCLAERAEIVIATDISTKQLSHASPHTRIEYLCCDAGAPPLTPATTDLITVAQAWHWLNAERFEKISNEILKVGGLLAVWCYNLFKIDEQIDAHIYQFYRDVVGEYWPPERKKVEEGYPDFPYLLTPLPAPQFNMTSHWDLDHLLGYLSSWSATQLYIEDNDSNPLAALEEALAPLWWPRSSKREIQWPLTVKIAKKSN